MRSPIARIEPEPVREKLPRGKDECLPLGKADDVKAQLQMDPKDERLASRPASKRSSKANLAAAGEPGYVLMSDAAVAAASAAVPDDKCGPGFELCNFPCRWPKLAAPLQRQLNSQTTRRKQESRKLRAVLVDGDMII